MTGVAAALLFTSLKGLQNESKQLPSSSISLFKSWRLALPVTCSDTSLDRPHSVCCCLPLVTFVLTSQQVPLFALEASLLGLLHDLPGEDLATTDNLPCQLCFYSALLFWCPHVCKHTQGKWPFCLQSCTVFLSMKGLAKLKRPQHALSAGVQLV